MDYMGKPRVSWANISATTWILLLVGTCTNIEPCSGISCLIGCGIPPPLYEENHTITCERNKKYIVGDQSVYHCGRNYVKVGGSAESRCTAQGTWTTPTLRCKAEDVPTEGLLRWTVETPASKPHVNQGEPLQNGRGSYVIGPGLANSDTCNEPPRPSGPHSVRVNGSYHRTSGSRVFYGCESGYKYISGPTYSRCSRHGAWDPEVILIKCREEGCVLPTGKDQTSQSVIYRVGTTIIFSCREGYELFGVSRQVCQEDETWSNTHPTCELTTCGTPTQPDYGRIEPHQHSYVYGSSVCYVCNYGHVVIGNNNRTCLGDKTWSGKLPSCQGIDCGFPNVPNADIFLSHNTTTYRSTAQITCRTGETYILCCNFRGFWHPPVKCQEPQITSEPTTIVDDLSTISQHSMDRREFSTQSKNYDSGVYQESVSSGYMSHMIWPFTLAPLILYVFTYRI